jgi:CARDB
MGTLEDVMFSSCHLATATRRLLLMSGLLTACEVTSLELQSPGTPGAPDSLKANVVPGPIEAPESTLLDALLQMRVGVRNDGNRTAGPGWFVRVFLSSDPQIDASDHQIDQFATTRELPPGVQDLYLRNKKLSGIGPGDYYIGSILDVTDVVPELNETDNTLATPGGITLLLLATEP